MASANQLKQWTDQFQNSWSVLAQAATCLIGIVGSFLLPPPVGISEDQTIWLRFAQFLIAALLGLLFVAARTWNDVKQTKWWAFFSTTLLILSVFSFIGYQYLSLSLTCKYYSQRVVVGDVYTLDGNAYIQENPGITCENLLKNFTGEVEQIWTKESINRRIITLASVYISSLPLFVACIVGIVQLISLNKRKVRNKSR